MGRSWMMAARGVRSPRSLGWTAGTPANARPQSQCTHEYLPTACNAWKSITLLQSTAEYAFLPCAGAPSCRRGASSATARGHAWLEELIDAAPPGLGVQQRGIGILQEHLGVGAIIGKYTDAHTHRDMQLLMLDTMGCAQSREYLAGTQGSVFAVSHLREQYHEFIPTVTADGVRVAHASHQALCD